MRSQAIKSSSFCSFSARTNQSGLWYAGIRKSIQIPFPQILSVAGKFRPYKLFPNPMPGPEIAFGDPSESVFCRSFSLNIQLAGLLLKSPAHLHSAWWRGQGQGPPELLCVRVDLIPHSPSPWDKPHHADSHRPMLSPAKFSWTAAGNRKLYRWIELSLLFLIELNSTLGHLS